MLPFQVVVYRDGQAIADSAYTLHVNEPDLVDIVTRLSNNLAGQPSTLNPGGRTRVMDAGVTVLGVRTGTGQRMVSADALDELRDAHAYPDAVYAARDLLSRLADRVTRDGAAYVADRIRLFAQPAGSAPHDGVGVWPTDVPVPGSIDQYGVRRVDLTGGQADAVTRAVHAELFNWSALRSPAGEVFLVSWRYLLPDE